MNKEVIVKRNKYGFRLIMDEQLPFSELLELVAERFRETEKFFKDTRMALSFEGRNLSDREQMEIVSAIESNTSVRIACIMDEDPRYEERMRICLEEEERRLELQAAQAFSQSGDVGTDFYRGNLRSGQVLESDSSITLIGDVNPGASVISRGNIVILGSLKGYAGAGAGGDESCFIFALEMKPIQLSIGEVIAKSPDRDKKTKPSRRKDNNSGIYSPQLATAKDGNICIEPVSRGCFNGF